VNGSVGPDGSGAGRDGSRSGRGGGVSGRADFGRPAGFRRAAALVPAADFGRAAVAFGPAAAFARVPPVRAAGLVPAVAFAREPLARVRDFALAFARAAFARVEGEAFVEDAEVALAVPPRLLLRCPGRDLGRLPSTPGSSLLSAATREK
jgi:hypothetical protein